MRAVLDADDLREAADAVIRAGEQLDIGLVLGRPGAFVDPVELLRALRGARGGVGVELAAAELVVAGPRGASRLAVSP